MTETVIKETLKHIAKVQEFILKCVIKIGLASANHDKSKLEEPELATFVKYTGKLKNTTYGSEEYKEYLKQMKPALDHHYANNRHHPEHFENGINGMNLLDVLEMLCDWYAATKRHDNGDIIKSLEINQKRFGVSDQLTEIFKNTVKMLEE